MSESDPVQQCIAAAALLVSAFAAGVAVWNGWQPRRLDEQRLRRDRQLAARSIQAICTPALAKLKDLVINENPRSKPMPIFPKKRVRGAHREINIAMNGIRRFDSHWKQLNETQLMQLLAIERNFSLCIEQLESKEKPGTLETMVDAYKDRFVKLEEASTTLAGLIDEIDAG